MTKRIVGAEYLKSVMFGHLTRSGACDGVTVPPIIFSSGGAANWDCLMPANWPHKCKHAFLGAKAEMQRLYDLEEEA